MKNSRPLSLHIPEPTGRPGDQPKFDFPLQAAGEAPRPPIDVDPHEIREMAYGLVRILDDEGRAVGPVGSRVSIPRRCVAACATWC